MAHTADYGQVKYKPMILQYSEILQYHFFKQQFMEHRQQQFYDPWLASAATKRAAKWQTTTINMTKDITTETKTETVTRILLSDKDPMVRSSIKSRRLGIAEEDWATTEMALRPQNTIYLHVRLYIYPIKTILKMWHKLLYVKIGVLDLCCWNTKKSPVY